VVIVERRLTHYRVPLFERLREQLAARQIELVLLVGEARPEEKAKHDGGHLPWAEVLPTHYFLWGAVCWQPFGAYLRDVELVIVNHENKLLYNHWLLWAPRRFKLAFWGHGRNMQTGTPDSMRERFKRWTIAKVDWWFAYTQISVDLVARTGFPVARITNLNNTIDTLSISHERDSVSKEEIAMLKRELGIAQQPVGAFIGSLYAEKRLDFLFEACRRVRQRVPGFQWLIIGDGEERPRVQEWAAAHDWVHWVGARKGRDKALYLGCADVVLNPGAVGLSILDSFVFGTPLVTTNCSNHGPEIAYLRHGENGLVTSDNVQEFALAVSSLLGDRVALARMSQVCASSADEYSIEKMASRLSDGILKALASPMLR
jgi:glycosyltransferase involved in cell wall biosynthesis